MMIRTSQFNSTIASGQTESLLKSGWEQQAWLAPTSVILFDEKDWSVWTAPWIGADKTGRPRLAAHLLSVFSLCLQNILDEPPKAK